MKPIILGEKMALYAIACYSNCRCFPLADDNYLARGDDSKTQIKLFYEFERRNVLDGGAVAERCRCAIKGGSLQSRLNSKYVWFVSRWGVSFHLGINATSFFDYVHQSTEILFEYSFKLSQPSRPSL